MSAGGSGRAGWLRSPSFDAAMVIGVLALALAMGAVAAASPALFLSVLAVDIWLLAYPHVTSTYTRIAFDRRSAKDHWFLLLGLPPLVLAATAGVAALGGAGGLFTAYYVGQTYHYTRQSYGIARAYRKSHAAAPGSDILSDAVVYAFPAWGLLHRAHQGHEFFYSYPLLLPRVPALVSHGVGVVAGALLLVWIGREVLRLRRGDRRTGHALFVLSHVVITVVSYVVVADITAGWLFVNIWHNAQYLLFVWAFNARRFRDGVDEESAFLSRICQPKNAWIYAVFCVAFGAGLHAGLGRLGASISWLPLPVLVFHLSANFHHYLVDGVVWKSSQPRRDALTRAIIANI